MYNVNILHLIEGAKQIRCWNDNMTFYIFHLEFLISLFWDFIHSTRIWIIDIQSIFIPI